MVAGRPDGSPVRVLLRPGDLTVQPGPGGDLSGTVLTHSFLGPVTRLTVRLSDGALARVDVGSAEAAAVPPGGEVSLRVAPEAALLGAGG